MIATVAAKPIPIEIRPPSAVRRNRSRPNWSVPNGCAHVGVRYETEKSTAFGSYGTTHGVITT